MNTLLLAQFLVLTSPLEFVIEELLVGVRLGLSRSQGGSGSSRPSEFLTVMMAWPAFMEWSKLSRNQAVARMIAKVSCSPSEVMEQLIDKRMGEWHSSCPADWTLEWLAGVVWPLGIKGACICEVDESEGFAWCESVGHACGELLWVQVWSFAKLTWCICIWVLLREGSTPSAASRREHTWTWVSINHHPHWG